MTFAVGVPVGVLLLAWLLIAMQITLVGESVALSWFGEAAIAPVFVLLPFLASSILVLRLTHALVERRRDGRAHKVEARSEFAGALCSVLAVVFAGLVQPTAWMQNGMAVWGTVALVFAVLSVVFQFSLGAVIVPDARVQRAADAAAARSCEQRIRTASELRLPTRRVAVRGLTVGVVIVLVVAPAGAGLVPAMQGGAVGARVGLALSLSVWSIYAIVAGQLALTIRARPARLGLAGAALVLGAAGWVAVAGAQAGMATADGDPSAAIWSAVFALCGLLVMWAATSRRTSPRCSLHGAFVVAHSGWLEGRLRAYRSRLATLDRIIAAERPIARLVRVVRWWFVPTALVKQIR